MNTIIYQLPSQDEIIRINKSDIRSDTITNRKLIKYGFNNINEQININELKLNKNYQAGLKFNFERNDDESITKKGEKFFGTKKFDQTFAEFWEILNVFQLMNQSDNILTNYPDVLENITSVYQKIKGVKSKFNIKNKFSKDKFNLVIKKYSDIDISEDTLFQFVVNELEDLIKNQK